MIKLKIDYNKCINCKKCVIACPANVFKSDDNNVYIDKNMICIKCLHCAAVCPKEAVGFDDNNNNTETILRSDSFKNAGGISKTIEEYITNRRSYRNFNRDMVPKSEILHALEVAKWAPSAKNEHPVKYIVVEGRAKLDIIMDLVIDYVRKTNISPEIIRIYQQGKNIVMGKANTIIIAHADPNATNPGVDAALALYSAELVLQSHGIGTCWSGYLIDICNDSEDIRNIIGMPENNKIYGVILVGYVENEKFLNIPNRLDKIDVEWI